MRKMQKNLTFDEKYRILSTEKQLNLLAKLSKDSDAKL